MHHGAALDDDGVVGDAENFLGVLLDQNGRHAFVADDAAQCRQQFIDEDRRQTFERLVEQHDARIEHQRAADREHLLLAARELMAEIASPFGEGAGTARRPSPWSSGPGRATAVRFSCTVSDLKMLRSCGTQPTPAWAR